MSKAGVVLLDLALKSTLSLYVGGMVKFIPPILFVCLLYLFCSCVLID